MQDTNTIPSIMDGQEYQAGHHAATLRRMLWREHLGLLPAQPLDVSEDPNAQPPDVCPNHWHEGDEWDKLVTDPLSDDVWKLWCDQATTNTDVFRYLFRADPDDNIRNFDDYQQFLPRDHMKQGHLFDKFMPSEDVRRNLDKIRVSSPRLKKSLRIPFTDSFCHRAILFGCHCTSSRMPRWPRRAYRSTTTRRVFLPKRSEEEQTWICLRLLEVGYESKRKERRDGFHIFLFLGLKGGVSLVIGVIYILLALVPELARW